MTDAAFLAAVRDHPDDDAPRLVYADWLDERGDGPRAEFIRLQCELHRLPDDDDRRPELAQREQELLFEHGHEWRAPLQELGLNTLTFHRGFVEQARIHVNDFLDQPAEVFARAPIHRLEFLHARGHGDRLAAVPELIYLSEFAAQQLRDAECANLARSPHLANLRVLRLSATAAAGLFADSLRMRGVLPRLEELHLAKCRFGDTATIWLAASLQSRRLRVLDLFHNHIGPDGAIALAEAPGAMSLRRLNLAWNQLGDVGARALARSEYLHGLEDLQLSRNGFSPRTLPLLSARFGSRVTADAAESQLV